MNGSLKLSDAGKWRLGFTKMTNHAGASQCYRWYQDPDEPGMAVLRNSRSLKAFECWRVVIEFHKETDYARASQCYRWYQNPDEREVAIVRERGSLELSNAGEWWLSFTKRWITREQVSVIVDIRILTNQRWPSYVRVDLKPSNAGDCWLNFTKRRITREQVGVMLMLGS